MIVRYKHADNKFSQKALRQSFRKRDFNLKRLNEMKAAVKTARKLKTENKDEALKLISCRL